jgi:hypothetical protein
MNYEQKYLKYKNKYLDLKNQSAGFIKINTKNPLLKDTDMVDCHEFIKSSDGKNITINKEVQKEDILKIIDYYMPLPYLESRSDLNIILINSKNYILINHKKDEEFTLLQLNDDFQITIIEKKDYPRFLIEDNIQIFNIDCETKIHDMFQSLYLNKNRFFIELFFYMNNDPITYINYNKLTTFLYTTSNNVFIKYNVIMNIVLSMIFMNKLHDIISWLNNFDNLLSLTTTNYDTFKTGDILKETDEKESLIEYFYSLKNTILSKLTTEYIVGSLNLTIKNKLPKIDVTDKILIYELICFVISYVDENPNLIYGYNYSLYIFQYRYHKLSKQDLKFKDMKNFINKDFMAVKQKFIFELVYLLYLLYKTNKEFTSEYNISQHLLIDYFLGVTKDKITFVPINKRQTFYNIRNADFKHFDDNRTFNISSINPYEIDEYDESILKYYIFEKKNPLFEYIQQTQITHPNYYPDCGERTLLNIYNYFLIQDSGFFNLNFNQTWHPKLKNFYRKYYNIQIITKNEKLQEMKNDWGFVVENIPELINKDNTFYYNGTYNLKPSIQNIVEISKILLGDPSIKNIADVFLKLNSKIDITNIKIGIEFNYDIVSYDDIKISFNENHAEFDLLITNTFDVVYLNEAYENIDRLLFTANDQLFKSIDRLQITKFTKEICLVSLKKDYKTIRDCLSNLDIEQIKILKLDDFYILIKELKFNIYNDNHINTRVNIPLGHSLHGLFNLEILIFENSFDQILNNSLKDLIKLTNLDFPDNFNNGGVSLGVAFYGLSNLKSLTFGKNFNQLIDDSFKDLINLESLTFGNKFNQPLNNSLFGLVNLKELILRRDFNQLLDDSFKDLKNLEFLSFGNEFDKPLNNSLDNLINLTDLNFGNNFKQPLNNSLKNLKKLKNLFLGFKFNQSLNNSLDNLENLENLMISKKFNQPLNDSFNKLINLKYLSFGSYFNQSLNNSLDNLSNLESLTFGDNFDKPLNQSLSKLNNLKKLKFGKNFNQSLYDSLNSLVNLEFLSFGINFNQPLNNSLHKLINLNSLYLPWDYNQSIDEAIKPLHKLKVNKITGTSQKLDDIIYY